MEGKTLRSQEIKGYAHRREYHIRKESGLSPPRRPETAYIYEASQYKNGFHLKNAYLCAPEIQKYRMDSRVLQKIAVWTKAFLKPVTQHPELFLFSILMSNVICWTGFTKGVCGNWFLTFLLTICDSFVFCLVAFCLKKIRLQVLIYIVVVILLYGELFSVCYYHATFNLNVVQLILATTPKESSELFLSALVSGEFWQSVLTTVFIVAISIIIPKILIKKSSLKNISIAATFILVIWSATRQIPTYHQLWKDYHSEDLEYCMADENTPFPYGPAVRFTYGLIYNHIAPSELNVLWDSTMSIKVDSCSFRCPLIILLIGESCNKRHYQVYDNNYLPTTPNMTKRLQQDRLIRYDDVVTKFNLTTDVIRGIFSTWDEDDHDKWTHHSLFTSLFKQSGYNVRLISNQFVISDNSMGDGLGGTILNDKKFSDIQFTNRNNHLFKFDEELLDLIPPIDSLTSSPTLLIVHFSGQHNRYRDRYPAEFAIFDASTSPAKFGGRSGKKICSEYDNATLYNDWVVEKIVSHFDNEDAVCLYFGDHGEEAYDWRNKYERSAENVITPEIARYQYEIPMMFFINDTFRVHHPDIVQQIYAGADKPMISSDISNILLYLGGISTKEYKDHRNILSPNYQPRKRLLRGKYDYDKIISSESTPCNGRRDGALGRRPTDET